MIARAIVILAALAVAMAAGLVFLPIAAIVDPVTRAAGAAFSVSGIFALIVASFTGPGPEPAGAAFLLTLWTVAVTICIVPIVVVSLIGEVAATASALFYIVTTGAIAAGLPWLVRARPLGASSGAAAGEVETRLALLFFLTGAFSGFVYWLIAGRGAGRASHSPLHPNG